MKATRELNEQVGRYMNLTHKNVSFVKSILRILAGISIVFNALILGGALLILAEVLGIIEEMYE